MCEVGAFVHGLSIGIGGAFVEAQCSASVISGWISRLYGHFITLVNSFHPCRVWYLLVRCDIS